MNQSMWIDIARTGTFTAGGGQRVTFTPSCFDRLIRDFNGRLHRVPLVFGHPDVSAPAYGWVKSLRRVGDTLQAKFKQVHEDVKTLVRKGHYKNVSISISPDKSFLHHVGLLGATQPAITGLREVSFSESADNLTVEFTIEEMQDEIERLKAEIAMLREQLAQQPETQPDEDVTEQDEEIEELTEEVAQLREQIEELQERGEEQEYDDRLKRLENTVNQGMVSPAEFALLRPFATALLKTKPMLTFANRHQPVHAVDALIEVLEARGKNPIFHNFASFMTPKHIDPDGEQAKQQKHKYSNPAYLI